MIEEFNTKIDTSIIMNVKTLFEKIFKKSCVNNDLTTNYLETLLIVSKNINSDFTLLCLKLTCKYFHKNILYTRKKILIKHLNRFVPLHKILNEKKYLCFYKYNEDFIQKYLKVINIEYLLKYQTLSENFIDKNYTFFTKIIKEKYSRKNTLTCFQVINIFFEHQPVSKKIIKRWILFFINENKINEVGWYSIFSNKQTSPKMINYIINFCKMSPFLISLNEEHMCKLISQNDNLFENTEDINLLFVKHKSIFFRMIFLKKIHCEDTLEILFEECSLHDPINCNYAFFFKFQKVTEKFLVKFKYVYENYFDIWCIILIHQSISENFIKNNIPLNVSLSTVFWNYISKYQSLSDIFMFENINVINFKNIFQFQKLSETFITNISINLDKKHWKSISKYQTLSEDFIRKYRNNIDWYYVSKYQKLSDKFVIEFREKLNCVKVLKHQRISPYVIKSFNFLEYYEWKCISKYQKLTSDFIIEFYEKLHWDYISEFQIIEEHVIRKYMNLIDWNKICEHQKLSEKFMCEFRDKIVWNHILKYEHLSEEFIFFNKDKIRIKNLRNLNEIDDLVIFYCLKNSFENITWYIENINISQTMLVKIIEHIRCINSENIFSNNKVICEKIIINQKLKSKYIEKYIDVFLMYLSNFWVLLSECQVLEDFFLKKFKENIIWYKYLSNGLISEKQKIKYNDKYLSMYY